MSGTYESAGKGYIAVVKLVAADNAAVNIRLR